VADVAVGGGAGTVRALVGEVRRRLESSGMTGARGEARDLVAAVLGVPRLWPSANGDAVVAAGVATAAADAAARRATGMPFAYAVGRASFRHLTLEVDQRVLIPRQETEVLVDLVLERAGRGGTAIDIGTGSGAIALALATEARFDRIIATDVAEGALEVARRNAERLAAQSRCPVEFRQGSLLAPVRGERARVLVSNPPYISHDEAGSLPASVRDWEPAVALFSGAGGLAATVSIVRGAVDVLEAGGLLALEVDVRRAALVVEAVAACGRFSDVRVALDLTGRERFVVATFAGE
jgi:release factor glutamine methyltransferase